MQHILNKLYQSSLYSYDGLKATLKNEFAFKMEVFMLLLLTPLALYVGESWLERGILIASWLLVILVEIINSAIESTIDKIGPEKHALSKQAKDQGSAAVFIAIVISIIIWSGVLLDKF